jgi:membrane-associated phospholipid phosphatase
LLLAGAPRLLALRWLFAVFAFGFLMMASRALFHWYDPLFDDLSLRVPSGHAGATVLVYGAVMLVCAAATQGRPRTAIILSGGALVAAIAASRVYLHAHSATEVVVGLAVGLLSLSWFGAGYLRTERRGAAGTVAVGFGDWRVLATAVAVLAVLIHGNRFSVWPILKAIALYVQITIDALV